MTTEELTLAQKHALLKKQVADHDARLIAIEGMVTRMETSIKESTAQLEELNKFLDRFNFGKAKIIGAISVIGFLFIGLPVTVLTYVRIYELLFGG